MINVALAGNANCGKTTLFNALTGANQFVGNWPGVTVEKKSGRLKKHKDVVIQDLPGIYSLSPYSPEEVVSRRYLIDGRPDVIVNVIDGTNLERNLYLTLQLMETGLPIICAVNMVDLLKKQGKRINLKKMEYLLGVPVIGISALKKTNLDVLIDMMIEEKHKEYSFPKYDDRLESALSMIEDQSCLMKICAFMQSSSLSKMMTFGETSRLIRRVAVKSKNLSKRLKKFLATRPGASLPMLVTTSSLASLT